MLYSEEEAKTKWCPMTRFVTFPPIYENGMVTMQNNRSGGGIDSTCIASLCMWWKRGFEDEETGYCGVIK